RIAQVILLKREHDHPNPLPAAAAHRAPLFNHPVPALRRRLRHRLLDQPDPLRRRQRVELRSIVLALAHLKLPSSRAPTSSIPPAPSQSANAIPPAPRIQAFHTDTSSAPCSPPSRQTSSAAARIRRTRSARSATPASP